MPRPPKVDADYFPFFVKDGTTLSVLEYKYGLAGIGFFTQVMRLLTSTPEHHICIADEARAIHAYKKIGCAEDEFKAMVTTMVSTGKLSKALWEDHKVLFCPALVDSLWSLYSRRDRKPLTETQLIGGYGTQAVDNNRVSVDINSIDVDNNRVSVPQSRAEQSKAEQSKAEKTLTTTSPPKKMAKLKDELAARWEKAFTDQVPMSAWGDIGRGRRNCVTLATKLRASSLITAFMALKRRGKSDFWRTATFTPTGFVARWAEIVDEAAKENEKPEISESTKEFLEGVYDKRS